MSRIYKSAGILIKNRRLLVERSAGKDFFIAPGGSIEPGESSKQALKRELKEEFDIDTDEIDFEKFGDFSAPAAGQVHRTVHMAVWVVKKWTGEPTPSSEAEELAWVTSDNPNKLPLGSIFEHEVIPELKNRKWID